jgi:hypothetical protein
MNYNYNIDDFSEDETKQMLEKYLYALRLINEPIYLKLKSFHFQQFKIFELFNDYYKGDNNFYIENISSKKNNLCLSYGDCKNNYTNKYRCTGNCKIDLSNSKILNNFDKDDFLIENKLINELIQKKYDEMKEMKENRKLYIRNRRNENKTLYNEIKEVQDKKKKILEEEYNIVIKTTLKFK